MIHPPAPPFSHTSGPQSARLMLIGEAWGQTESETGLPFAGESGKELWRMLGEAMPHIAPAEHAVASLAFRDTAKWLAARDTWLASASILMTNVLALRPRDNKMENICGSKSEVGPNYPFSHLAQGKYLRPEYFGELDRLATEIGEVHPNVIVALGNTACWALLHVTNIGSIRGNVAPCYNVGKIALSLAGIKTLPTYHPAAVLRQWPWRPIVVADLMKAAREAGFSEIRRPERYVLISPALKEIEDWTHDVLTNPPPFLAVDTETGAGQIKCVGFAKSRSEVIVIPFVDFGKLGGSYWHKPSDEAAAWFCVKMLLESNIPKIMQNGIYDLQYFLRYPLRPNACIEDTMLLHHSIFPELQKGLGFLGSIYTNEASWKLMNRKRATDVEKRDE